MFCFKKQTELDEVNMEFKPVIAINSLRPSDAYMRQ